MVDNWMLVKVLMYRTMIVYIIKKMDIAIMYKLMVDKMLVNIRKINKLMTENVFMENTQKIRLMMDNGECEEVNIDDRHWDVEQVDDGCWNDQYEGDYDQYEGDYDDFTDEQGEED